MRPAARQPGALPAVRAASAGYCQFLGPAADVPTGQTYNNRLIVTMDDYKSPTSHFDPPLDELNCDGSAGFGDVNSLVGLPSDQ